MNQPALLIIDVFSGQTTKPVIDKMTENNIKLVKVPANMQPSSSKSELDEDGDEWLDGDEEPVRNICDLIDDM